MIAEIQRVTEIPPFMIKIQNAQLAVRLCGRLLRDKKASNACRPGTVSPRHGMFRHRGNHHYG